MGIQVNSDIEIEPPENTSLDVAAQESQKNASIGSLREEETAYAIKNISENTAKTSNVELSSMTNSVNQPGVQFQSVQGKGVQLYPGDSSLFDFAKEKNSSPNWRTASS